MDFPPLTPVLAATSRVLLAGLRRLWRPELHHLGVTVSLVPPLWLALGGKSYYALPVFILLHAAGAVEICERWRRLGHELSRAVDGAWSSLSPAEREKAAVLAGDCGEAGAIRRFGRSASGHVPPVVSTHLTNRYWRPDDATLRATTLVVIGYRRSWLDQRCATVRPAGRVVNRWDVDNDEAGTRLWICRLRSGVHLGDLVRFTAVP